jgi:hypothetical protein
MACSVAKKYGIWDELVTAALQWTRKFSCAFDKDQRSPVGSGAMSCSVLLLNKFELDQGIDPDIQSLE